MKSFILYFAYFISVFSRIIIIIIIILRIN